MAKPFAKRFYASAAWHKTERAVMQAHNYTCERCGKPARIVHHRTYLTPENITDPAITLGWDNLECLCIDCHNAEHRQNGGDTMPGLAFDANGRLTKTQN